MSTAARRTVLLFVLCALAALWLIALAAVGVRGDSSYWRVGWNTLISPDIPIAEWAFDTDDDPATGASELPAGATATAPGTDLALAVSSRGAWLIDPVTQRRTDIRTVGGSVSADMASRSFVVRVPTSAVRPTGRWRIRLAAGLADQTGQWFAPAWNRNGTADPVIDQDGTRIYNEAFRSMTDEPALSYSDVTQALLSTTDRVITQSWTPNTTVSVSVSPGTTTVTIRPPRGR